MKTRTAALLLTIVAAGLLLFKGSEQAATAAGLLGALLALAAILLVSGRMRLVVSVLSALAWLAALVLAVLDPSVTVLAAVAGSAGAVLTVVRGAAWPGWSSRYARDTDPDRDDQASPREMWESLDRGFDPTRRADASPDDQPGTG
ncbi:MAG: Trp biosynthesis-associated membrane protein [Candidatus Nanopelagicales bacterium]